MPIKTKSIKLRAFALLSISSSTMAEIITSTRFTVDLSNSPPLWNRSSKRVVLVKNINTSAKNKITYTMLNKGLVVAANTKIKIKLPNEIINGNFIFC